MAYHNVPTREVEIVKLRKVCPGTYTVASRHGSCVQYFAARYVPKELRDYLAAADRKQIYVQAVGTRSGRWQLRALADDQSQQW